MIYAAKLLVIVVVSVGFVGGQQCNELVCPGIGCLTRDNVCNDINDCPDGRGSYFDETNCSGKIYIRIYSLNHFLKVLYFSYANVFRLFTVKLTCF